MSTIYKKLAGMFHVKQPFQIRVIERSSSKLRLEEWRSSEDLVKLTQKLHLNQDFRLLLDMLKNESPANMVFADVVAPIDARACHQAKIEGYNAVFANIEAASRISKPVEYAEPTYEQETIET